MTRSLELRVCIAHKSIPALVGQRMKCALFMPDAALTPYPAYKIVQIQYIAEFS